MQEVQFKRKKKRGSHEILQPRRAKKRVHHKENLKREVAKKPRTKKKGIGKWSNHIAAGPYPLGWRKKWFEVRKPERLGVPLGDLTGKPFLAKPGKRRHKEVKK